MKVLALASALVALGAAIWLVRSHQQGLDNLRRCGTVEPGGARSALVQALGTPRHTELNPARTRLVLVFSSPLFVAQPIRAVVNVRDDVVVEIDCGNGRIRTHDKY